MPVLRRRPDTAAPALRTIVVDDGSNPADRDAADDVTVVRLRRTRGPAAARNAGLAQVHTPLVAFLDADVSRPRDWLDPLLAHFADPARGARRTPRGGRAGHRCAGRATSSGTARSTSARSRPAWPRDPRQLRAGRRTGVPDRRACARSAASTSPCASARTSTSCGDSSMHGHRCRYEPASVVHHRPGARWSAMLRQRAGYGRSAAALAAKHPGALAPVRMSGWSAGVWALVALRRPWLALGVAGGTAVALHAQAPRRATRGDRARLVRARASRRRSPAGEGASPGCGGRPLSLLAVVVAEARLPLLAAAVGAVARRRGQRAQRPRRCSTRRCVLADEMAYGAGVWLGVVRAARAEAPLRARVHDVAEARRRLMSLHSTHTVSGITPQRMSAREHHAAEADGEHALQRRRHHEPGDEHDGNGRAAEAPPASSAPPLNVRPTPCANRFGGPGTKRCCDVGQARRDDAGDELAQRAEARTGQHTGEEAVRERAPAPTTAGGEVERCPAAPPRRPRGGRTSR